MNQKELAKIREKYPIGTTLELDYMDEKGMPDGMQGVVRNVDDAGQIHMDWDNGRRLALVPGEDVFHVVKEKEIRVLVVEPLQAPYEKNIENDYKAMQKVVGGYIEYVPLADGKCHIYCNEEGVIEGLPANRVMDNGSVIFGTFFICGDTNDGNDKSLSDEQMEFYSERFKNPEHFMALDQEFVGCEISSFSSFDEFFSVLGSGAVNENLEVDEFEDIER